MNKIEWTDRTWNPVRGCSRVSEGCRNCYAERMAARFSAGGEPFHGFAERHAIRTSHVDRRGNEYTQPSTRPSWTGRVELIPSKLNEPLRWRKPARVFVNSMSDLFHESLSDADIIAVFDVMRLSGPDSHTFQILTKRPERMLSFCGRLRFNGHGEGRTWLAPSAEKQDGGYRLMGGNGATGMPWVWLGVSVEDQKTADERIPLLLQTPAAVRFVSYEPALGPVDFTRLTLLLEDQLGNCSPGVWLNALTGHVIGPDDMLPSKLDWLIVGGESGPGARPCDVEWIRSAVRQCKAAGVACFVKQLGTKPTERGGEFYSFQNWVNKARSWIGGTGAVCFDASGRRCRNGGDMMRARDENAFPVSFHLPMKLRARKGGDPSEWPEELSVREFPT